jgi:hypothetical protein
MKKFFCIFFVLQLAVLPLFPAMKFVFMFRSSFTSSWGSLSGNIGSFMKKDCAKQKEMKSVIDLDRFEVFEGYA